MKKSLILAALVLISAGCFAQKNPLVKKAKSLVSSETPDYVAARAAIKEALATEPTAENYYWAGMIGYTEVKNEQDNQMLGKGIDHAKAGEAAIESYDYWMKADQLAMVPTLDKKGREVVDQKTRNNISKKLIEYYKQRVYINYADYANKELKDYEAAYQAFKRHISIPDLEMMQNDKLQKEMPRDTLYQLFQYYTAAFAIQTDRHEEALKLLELLKDENCEPITVNQHLYQEYMAVKDTAKAVEALQHAINRFPTENWFLQNLINYYIRSGQEQTAVDYLAQAIEREPNVAQYYLVRGDLNEDLGNYEAALKDYDDALRCNPQLADAVAGKGRVYYNQAVKLNEAAALISDNKEYKKALDEMNEVFRQSLPFFEQAHEMDPTNAKYLKILKGLYYRFHMDAKYDEAEAKLSNL